MPKWTWRIESWRIEFWRVKQVAPRHAFETKDRIHRGERLRGGVGINAGTCCNLGEW